MTLTRWKLLAGLLGLSMAGVAATADPQCPAKTAGPPPVPCPVVVGVPVIPAAAVAEAVQVGTKPPLDIPAPPPPEVTVAAAPPALPVPAAAKDPEPPKLPEPVSAPPPQAVIIERPKPTAPAPVLPEVRLEPPTPAAAPPAKPPELPPPVDPPVLTGPATTPPPAPQRLDPPAIPKQSLQASPEPLPAGAVRVVVNLGAGQPRFEVLAGDDTLLKVVSDRVDVQSPSVKGETMSALKAAGGVRFSAPGCEGVCQDLTVLPGSGDVELSGNVRVKCKQGKGETEIVASKMTFKLGSAPAYAVPEPAATLNTTFVTPTRR
jgi:hypothetical protein